MADNATSRATSYTHDVRISVSIHRPITMWFNNDENFKGVICCLFSSNHCSYEEISTNNCSISRLLSAYKVNEVLQGCKCNGLDWLCGSLKKGSVGKRSSREL